MGKNCLGKCPKCGSENRTHEDTEFTISCVVFECTCNDCGTEYHEWYKMKYIETITIQEN